MVLDFNEILPKKVLSLPAFYQEKKITQTTMLVYISYPLYNIILNVTAV